MCASLKKDDDDDDDKGIFIFASCFLSEVKESHFNSSIFLTLHPPIRIKLCACGTKWKTSCARAESRKKLKQIELNYPFGSTIFVVVSFAIRKLDPFFLFGLMGPSISACVRLFLSFVSLLFQYPLFLSFLIKWCRTSSKTMCLFMTFYPFEYFCLTHRFSFRSF